MYIKSVTVDGFKSYAQRTDISGFDPLFNAITGLNGSGKSNILDSICFLLGITNLSQVRATNLQDLVYKNGQAGINKATVSITFDNSNKDQSPMGMEAHNEITITRQIVIGGRNKYLINGVNAQNSRVSDLFRSVGLNVNNPHFLIMQGRVTKVMNMKPPEILSMIEEATGTSMYESKKDSAQRMIEKKENKLNQINRTLDEEITPTIQKLHDERSSYLEFQKVQREVERLSRLLIAYHFLTVERVANNASGEIEEMNGEKEKLESEVEDRCSSSKLFRKYFIVDFPARQDRNLVKDSKAKLSQLESTLGSKEKIEAKAQSNLSNQREVINSEKRKLKGLQKSKSECESAIKSKSKALDSLQSACDKLESESVKLAEAYTAAEKHFQAVTTGLASSDTGEEASWQAQLLKAKKDISQLQTETKQVISINVGTTKQELKSKQSELKKTEATYKQDLEVLKKVEKRLVEIKTQMEKLNYTEGEEEQLKAQKHDLSTKIQKMSRLTQGLFNKFPNLQFEYRDPESNWDHRRVKGLVADLVDVKDVANATALEVVAGGRLYNVVVDTHETGAKLLKNGQLKRRCTIIPLNKVAARTINKEVVTHAKSIVGRDNVNLALSLVGMDEEIRKALEYVFGGALVCDTMENANKVAFNPNVKTRTVTLAGELFDPSGTLTGGARPKVTPVLAELKEIKSVQQDTSEDYAALDVKLQEVTHVSAKYHDLKNQSTLKEREINSLKQRISDTSHGRLARRRSQHPRIASAKMQDQCAELERKIANAPAERERELKEAEKQMNKAGSAAEKAGHSAAAKRDVSKDSNFIRISPCVHLGTFVQPGTLVHFYPQELNTMKLEVQELEKEVNDYGEQIARVESSIEEAQVVYQSVKETVDAELQQHRDHIQETSHDIQQRIKQRELVQQEAGKANKRLQEQTNAIEKCLRESKDASNKVTAMLEEHEWIANEKSLFGRQSSPYDFEANPPKEASRRLEKLKERQEKLSTSVNMRAMSLLGKAEEKYNELIKKKMIVQNDKEKIQKTIEELDQMKNKAVTKAYVQVNKNFGEIFSTLLPGATAKLAPAEGSSVLAGLEFHVGFGDVWKTNLNELSGGQRSLVALSLILAMLLLKPAPIYILDEVDAALDLSHTQNIGGMLREHFKHSQFIVVSLKDGMFNNANVLFRTKFVDGVSTVARY
uniref:Structural maintenance of chromosomes protein n=1 Tax=Ciona savignyi TaxID=51511 RepID=H2YJF7_CIOSA